MALEFGHSRFQRRFFYYVKRQERKIKKTAPAIQSAA